MAKRGRPQQFSVLPGAKLIETAEVFYEYTQGRLQGIKYEGAVLGAVDKFKAKDPHWRISRSSVKRMIDMASSKKHDAQFRVTKYCDLGTRAEITAIGFEPLQKFESLYAKKARAKITREPTIHP